MASMANNTTKGSSTFMGPSKSERSSRRHINSLVSRRYITSAQGNTLKRHGVRHRAVIESVSRTLRDAKCGIVRCDPKSESPVDIAIYVPWVGKEVDAQIASVTGLAVGEIAKSLSEAVDGVEKAVVPSIIVPKAENCTAIEDVDVEQAEMTNTTSAKAAQAMPRAVNTAQGTTSTTFDARKTALTPYSWVDRLGAALAEPAERNSIPIAIASRYKFTIGGHPAWSGLQANPQCLSYASIVIICYEGNDAKFAVVPPSPALLSHVLMGEGGLPEDMFCVKREYLVEAVNGVIGAAVRGEAYCAPGSSVKMNGWRPAMMSMEEIAMG